MGPSAPFQFGCPRDVVVGDVVVGDVVVGDVVVGDVVVGDVVVGDVASKKMVHHSPPTPPSCHTLAGACRDASTGNQVCNGETKPYYLRENAKNNLPLLERVVREEDPHYLTRRVSSLSLSFWFLFLSLPLARKKYPVSTGGYPVSP